ncbi:MAG TPA: toprim domain-containing protein, partial [Terriglobales bacterium]|nr:toprim domain-containing protein [Terriglobales bacterium]
NLTGSPAESYIEKRQLSPATVTRYGLGYAPDSWDALLTHMKKLGYDEPLLRRAGLAAVGQSGKYYDVFRGRLIFPIIDVRGDVIAFGGRVLGEGTPKYLNSPDTPAFKKSRSLFSLNFAKAVKGDRLILAEGYMDVIAMNQAGFAETVATLGTALTTEQAKLMSRYAKEVVIAYDTDEAGRKATERAIGILSAAGLKARVLRYEGAKDPDEYIKTYGAAGLRRKLDSSSTSIDYQIEQAGAGKNLSDPNDKVEYLKSVAVILAGVGSPVAVDVYAGRVAAEMKVDKQSLLTEVGRIAAASRKKEAAREVTEERRRITSGPSPRVNPQRAANLKVSRAEEGVICLLFSNPEYLAALAGQLSEDDFATEFNKKVFLTLKNVIETGGVPDISDFSELEMSETGAIAGMIGLKEQLAGTMDELLQFIETLRRARQRRGLSADDPEALKKYLETLAK